MQDLDIEVIQQKRHSIDGVACVLKQHASLASGHEPFRNALCKAGICGLEQSSDVFKTLFIEIDLW